MTPHIWKLSSFLSYIYLSIYLIMIMKLSLFLFLFLFLLSPYIKFVLQMRIKKWLLISAKVQKATVILIVARF